jgi:acetate kinase
MAKAILALNAGSSSIKFAVYRSRDGDLSLICKGHMDQHTADSHFTIKNPDGKIIGDGTPALDPGADLTLTLIERLEPILGNLELAAVGHRIVHGGPRYFDPIVLDQHLLHELDELTPLAPLHQPGCLNPVRSLLKAQPKLQQVACFDTAFHRGLDPVYQRFPIPDIGNGIHRYGFHGLSFEHVASELNEPGMRVVIAHLGSGSSVCAVRDGRSINTSMSLTPLDGLMMATRCGAVDPGLLLYLQKSMGYSVADVEDLLYHKSGLLGVSGVSGDMRTLLAASDPDSKLAVDQFCARAVEHIAAMATSLDGLDMIAFTGGIGENSFAIRERICARLRWLGAELCSRANHQGSECISAPESRVSIRVTPADEERVIAQHTAKLAASCSN